MTTAGEQAFGHRPVLLEEVMEALGIKPDGVYIDLTFGRGGHSGAILDRLGPQGRLFAVDKDPEAVAYGRARFADDPRFVLAQGSFVVLEDLVEDAGVQGEVSGILMDLGVSSPQLDDPQRGFSFQADGKLDMRMDPTQGRGAAQWLAEADVDEISQVLREYGEERHAKRLARAIVEARSEAPIETTGRLADIIARAQPSKEKHKHPATRSFQAIRIFVNRELDDLAACLAQVPAVLAPGGRLVVISFHSLEDRMVKRFMRRQVEGARLPRKLPVPQQAHESGFRLHGRALRPSAEECERNPRARSAVLRVLEKRA